MAYIRLPAAVPHPEHCASRWTVNGDHNDCRILQIRHFVYSNGGISGCFWAHRPAAHAPSSPLPGLFHDSTAPGYRVSPGRRIVRWSPSKPGDGADRSGDRLPGPRRPRISFCIQGRTALRKTTRCITSFISGIIPALGHKSNSRMYEFIKIL